MPKRIGVFCSGGDSPGMNACVRAVTRSAISLGHEVVGINRGYAGLLTEDFWTNQSGGATLTLRCVSGWSRYGGAFLRSSRSEEFRAVEGQKKAAEILRRHNIDALVAVGGDGTFAGAIELAKYWDGQIIGCPGTIDNDLMGTDYTIGFSTAVATAVDAVDKIRDTAESHERMFLIEVMGRHSGYIAAYVAIACGAEIAAVPETDTDIPKIIEQLKELKKRGKRSIMIIVAEGDEKGGAQILNEELKKHGSPFQSRVAILGHLQRGGAPTPEDRRRATQMGCGAVVAIQEEKTGLMIGTANDECLETPFEIVIEGHRPIPPHLLDLLELTAS
jgi:6-phosphofructokinase 1